jgi:hypothetical protein
MTGDEREDDDLLMTIARLAAHDVSPRRADRLRGRCHAVLRAPARRTLAIDTAVAQPFRRLIGPALAGAWCLAYLAAIIRFAAAVYGF